MTALSNIPYDWIRRIPQSLLEKDDIPLFATPGPFPWETLSAFLSKTFQLEKLEIKPGNWEPCSDETALKGLSSSLRYINIELSPLPGLVTWAMNEKDLNLLMPLILTKEIRATDCIDNEYKEGFLHFIAMEALLAFNRSEYDKNLSPHIIDSEKKPKGTALYMDITIYTNGATFLGRLIFSDEFRQAWKERYSEHKMTLQMSPGLSAKLHTTIHLEAGSVMMNQQEWKSVCEGDYIPLDQCTLEPGTDKTRVMITLDGQPLFRARVKQGNIKILEFPLYYEVETMVDHEDNDEDTDEYFDESEFDEDESDFLDDEEHDDEDEFDLSDDLEDKKETIREEDSHRNEKHATEEKITAQAPANKPKPLAMENIELSLVVEVGRLQISIQKLMELQPGNLLELDVHPENGVDLVINGKCVARGELLRIGETLGVRILDKG